MDSGSLIMYLIFALISLVIWYFVFRWIFSVGEQIKQKESIINLLKLIAQKQGASDDEIHNAIT